MNFPQVLFKMECLTPLRGVTVYAKTRAVNGDLGGVFIHSIGQNSSPSRAKKNPFTIISKHGAIIEKDGKKSLLMLLNGTRQEKDQSTGKVSFFHFKTLNYDLDQLASNLQERIIKPYERSLSHLLDPPDKATLSPAVKAQLYAEGHQRLLPPLLVLLFSLVGLSALLSQELNRRGRQKRIGLAIGISICINIGLIALINMNGRWPLTIPLAYFSVIFIGIISFIILEKQSFIIWWNGFISRKATSGNTRKETTE